MSNPLCPVTGEPAVRLVQWVDAGLLGEMWRIVFKTDAYPSFRGTRRFGLWQSPTGLYFFDPPFAGDHDFYRQRYGYEVLHGVWDRAAERDEYAIVAGYLRPGDRVLDVGCGNASFRAVIPQTHYVGLDPNMGKVIAGVVAETLTDHLAAHAGEYDAVCAFQVIEHVEDPRAFFAEMLRAAKPGGLAVLGVPHVPSAMARIPNFLINAPPHHLTWWTKEALAQLATRAGATVVAIETAQWTAYDAMVYWIERFSLVRCRDERYRHSWWWHAANLLSFYPARLMHALRIVPKRRDEGAGLVLIARKAS